MRTKTERYSCAVSGLAILTALVLGITYVPSLAAQSLEERIDTLARQVTQLNEVILELRSEIVQSRKETQELRRQLSTIESPDASGSGSFADAEELPPASSRGAMPQQ